MTPPPSWVKPPKLLYLVTEAGYFFSHRYALAKAAQKSGYDVTVATIPGVYRQQLLDEGFHVRSLTKMTRAGLNPFQQLSSIFEIYRIYKKERPDIVHHVAMKPVLYGTIAAWAAGVPYVVNAITGLGYVFISSSLKAKVLRFWIWRFFKCLFKKPGRILILQNKDDFHLFSQIVPLSHLSLIRGSGVNTEVFSPIKKSKSPRSFKIVLPARLLGDKGIKEAMEASCLLKQKGFSFELILAGGVDRQNPSGIPRSQIKKWEENGLCTWVGKVENMAKLYQSSDIVLLPSYREGLPKALLEAAACGLPIVTTDVPGCREIVQNGKTGLLVPVRSVQPLAEALQKLFKDKELRNTLGKNARVATELHFSEETILDQTLQLYHSFF